MVSLAPVLVLLVSLLHPAWEPAHTLAIEIGSNSSAIANANIKSGFTKQITNWKMGDWSLPSEGQASYTLTLDVSALGHGFGGPSNAMVMARLSATGKQDQKILAHWVARCAEEEAILGNPHFLPGLDSSGIVGLLGQRIRAYLAELASGPQSIEATVDSIPSADLGRFGSINFWRPETGGGIEPTEAVNLRFSPADRFRIQIKPTAEITVRMLLQAPDGMIRESYCPELPPVTSALKWSSFPADASMGFGPNPKAGTWKVILLVESSIPEAQKYFQAQSFQIWGGNQTVFPQISNASSLDMNRLKQTLRLAVLDQSILTWRKIVMPIQIMATSN